MRVLIVEDEPKLANLLRKGLTAQGFAADIATDGDDGTTGAAGAVATGETAALGRARGLDSIDYLDRNDSASYFAEVGGLVETGPTGTNVADLFCVLIERG